MGEHPTIPTADICTSANRHGLTPRSNYHINLLTHSPPARLPTTHQLVYPPLF